MDSGLRRYIWSKLQVKIKKNATQRETEALKEPLALI